MPWTCPSDAARVTLSEAIATNSPKRLSDASLLGKTRPCKIGNCHLRKLMYFPALTAIRYCEPFQAYRQQLLDTGKTKIQFVVTGFDIT